MKKIKLTLLCSLTAAVLLPAVAQADIAYNIGAVSLYKSKGVDQNTGDASDFRPAVQGGVDWSHASGFYVSNWNSSGKFGAANLEIDFQAGFVRKLTETISYDIGVLTYAYPDEASWNATELRASVSVGAFKLYYGNVLAKAAQGDQFYGVDYVRPLTDKLTFGFGVGIKNPKNRNNLDNPDADKNNAFGNVSLAYNLGAGLVTKLDISGANESVYGAAGKTRAVVSVNQSF